MTNQGSEPGRNIQLTAVLPDELSFEDASAGGRQDGQAVIFRIDSLPPGEAASFNVSATAEDAGDVRFYTEMTSAVLTEPVRETESTKLYSSATADDLDEMGVEGDME